MANPPSRSTSDYVYDLVKSIVDGTGPTLFGTINTNVTNGLPTVQQTTDMSAGGSPSNAPAATTAIASLSAIPAGTYDFYLTACISGTVADVDKSNIAFNIAGTQKLLIISAANGTTDHVVFRATVGAATAVTLTAVANSTASSVYRGTIIARRVA